MKIAVFGATGPSGLQVVQQALDQKDIVYALVRNPAKLEHIKSENLHVEKIDLLNPDSFKDYLKGMDAVISCIGYPGIAVFKISIYIDSIKSIVSGMRSSGVKRLVCMTSYYTKYQTGVYPYHYRFLLRAMLGRHFDDMYEMETYLEKECQDIDYTIVRPPHLTNDPLSDNYEVCVEEDYHVTNPKAIKRMPRSEVAKFILKITNSNEYIKKAIAIAGLQK